MSDVVSIQQQQNIIEIYFEGHSIRTFMHNDTFYFCGTDTTKALGYTNLHDPLSQVEEADLVIREVRNSRKELRPTKFLVEAAFYELLFRSNKPAAKRFTRKVSGEILPTIRKTGRYQTEEVTSIIQDNARPYTVMYPSEFRNLIPKTGMSEADFYLFIYQKLHPEGTYEAMKSRTVSRRSSWFRKDNYDRETGKRVYLHQYYQENGIELNSYQKGQLTVIIQHMLPKNSNKNDFLRICNSVFGQKGITSS